MKVAGSLRWVLLWAAANLGLLGGCVSVTMDNTMVAAEAGGQMREATVAILGRRHASDYDTELEFVTCVANHVSRAGRDIRVLPEQDFLDALYPWFEPRTAPTHPAGLNRLMEVAPVREALERKRITYLVWIDGSTTRSDMAGSMTCGIGAGAAGCFGFGTWDDDSKYEAVIWDFAGQREVGRISATASGQSYLPALVVPIPIIAPVQNTACGGLASQLLQFLSTE